MQVHLPPVTGAYKLVEYGGRAGEYPHQGAMLIPFTLPPGWTMRQNPEISGNNKDVQTIYDRSGTARANYTHCRGCTPRFDSWTVT